MPDVAATGFTPAAHRRVALVPLMIAQTLDAAAAGVTVTVSAVTASHLSGATWSAGFAQSSTVVGAAALSMPIARLAASRGRRTALVTAYGIAAIGGLVAAAGVAAGSLLLFLAALAALGGGTVAGLALRFAAADLEADPARRPRSIALVLWMATVGSLVGPNIAQAAERSAPAAPFLLIGAFHAVSVVVVATLRRTRPAARAGRASLTAPTAITTASTRAVRIASTTAVIGHMAMTGLMGMAPVFLTQAGASGAVVGAIMSAHLVGMYAASPLVGAIVRRLGALPSCAATLVIDAAACLLIVLGESSSLVFAIGLTLLGIGWSFGMIASSSVLASSPPAGRIRAQGRLDTLINVGGGTASIAAGVVVASAGYPVLAALVGAAVIAVAIAIALTRRQSLRSSI